MSTRVTRISAPSILVSALLLAGCEAKVTADLATDAPADRNIQQVNVSLTGLEFRKDDGGTETMSFNDGEAVNLFDYLDGNTIRLFTDEALPDGTYDGVRLTFDDDPADDPTIVDADGNSFPLAMAEGDYADLDISIEEDESSDDAFTLTLDLRQSLIFDDGEDEYTLRPYLRSIDSDRAGQITGLVTFTCPSGSTLVDGGAVYLFTGEDVEPDDRDGSGVEPYATTDVYTTTDGQSAYALRFLPEGSYTIAITCNGDEENPDTDDTNDMEFAQIDNVQVDEDETLRFDFTD